MGTIISLEEDINGGDVEKVPRGTFFTKVFHVEHREY